MVAASLIFYYYAKYNVKCGEPDPYGWFFSQEYFQKCGKEYDALGFTLTGGTGVEWFTKPGATNTFPLNVVWDKGRNAEPVTVTYTGDTTNIIAKLTSVGNTTNTQMFNVYLYVPSGTQIGTYTVNIKIIQAEGLFQEDPIVVIVQ